MPPGSRHMKGVRHDSTPIFLPDGRLGTPLDIFHVASCLAQSMPYNPAETSRAHPTTAPTLQRAESVYRSHPPTPPVTAPAAPPPRIPSTRGRKRQVDTSTHFCPNPACAYHGWVGWDNLR